MEIKKYTDEHTNERGGRKREREREERGWGKKRSARRFFESRRVKVRARVGGWVVVSAKESHRRTGGEGGRGEGGGCWSRWMRMKRRMREEEGGKGGLGDGGSGPS